MTDEQMAELFRLSALSFRNGVVGSLLRGNDTGCFSTEQYKERWLKLKVEEDERIKAKAGVDFISFSRDHFIRLCERSARVAGWDDWGRHHLDSLESYGIMEVRRDVWAKDD